MICYNKGKKHKEKMKMKRNMNQWLDNIKASERKKAMPILSFPSMQLLGITVKDLISSGRSQADGMKMIADRTDALAAVSLMDLSVEAEAFGSTVRFSEDEVPTVVGSIVSSAAQAEALQVPHIGDKRTGIYLEAIERAAKLITDRPVFAGIIGPFSLAGRLVDVTEAMIYCYEEPGTIPTILQKVTDFLIEYASAYRAAGAHGIIMAEPLAGLLSSSLAAEFSEPYVKKINDAVQDENFIVIYHNCGNAISMRDILTHIPDNVVAMGNIDPAGQIRNGTPQSVRQETLRIMAECCAHKNFVISSGCDIPPLSPWENIDAFFAAVEEFYHL